LLETISNTNNRRFTVIQHYLLLRQTNHDFPSSSHHPPLVTEPAAYLLLTPTYITEDGNGKGREGGYCHSRNYYGAILSEKKAWPKIGNHLQEYHAACVADQLLLKSTKKLGKKYP